MQYDPERHHRRSIRLREFSYAEAGSYFITICTHQRECIFGEVVGDHVVLSGFAEIVRDEWQRSAIIRRELKLDAFVVMPNHVHGIVYIVGIDSAVGAHGHAPLPSGLHRPPRSIGAFVGRFKGACTRDINVLRNTPGAAVWQRNYYEHVIRDDDDLARIQTYVGDNPRRWAEDEYNPSHL